MNQPLRFGKYEVSEVLGKGAMGVVYKAFDPNIRRPVAIKTIRKEIIDDDRAGTLVARFKNEAQAAGRLSHPGIVAVYEYGEDDDVAYIAMEYVQSNPLREYFNRGTRFEERDAVSVMAQLLDALEYAHEQGVWHRDIKPANILIMTNGRLKVADFGIARIDTSNLTQTGAVMGTPGYMAPEQYAGQSVDWRADIFSSGVVLYQLLTGARPFSGRAETVAFKICYENPPSPSQLDATRGWERYDPVIAKALAKEPKDRFQTASEMRAAILEAYAAPVSPALSEETIITEPTQPIGIHEPSVPSRSHSGSLPLSPGSGGSGGSGGSTPPPTGWDGAVLKQVEDQLARTVGPVARVMVKRAAQRTMDIEKLYTLISEALPTPEERNAFLANRPKRSSTNPGGTLSATRTTATRTSATRTSATRAGDTRTAQTIALTPEAIDEAGRALTPYLGPIAKVVVKRAAAVTQNRQEFYQILADELSTEKDRAGFLRAVGAVI